MSKFIFIACLYFLIGLGSTAQVLPDVKLTTLDGAVFETNKLSKVASRPMVLSFWATWCVPCINELNAINENLDDWNDKSKFDFYAISVDDSRTSKRVPAIVNGKGWTFNVLYDKNQDLKRELNIMNIPYTIVIKNGKIIYRQAGYVTGNENQLYRIIEENQ